MSQFGLESCWKIVIANLIIFVVLYTEVEVFLDKRVRETRQTAGANSRRNKEARDFTDPFIHKSTLVGTIIVINTKAKSLIGKKSLNTYYKRNVDNAV